MGFNIMGAGIALTVLASAWSPASAHAPTPTVISSPGTGSAPTVAPASRPTAPFIPADFMVPVLVEADGFKMVALGPDLVKTDFEAYMSSIEHLQKTFSRSTSWPHEGITAAEAMQDMTTEQARFRNRASFAYAVLTPDGTRERGSVYVYPSPVPGYDAMVRMWVTQAEYDAGFDATLYQWVTHWIKKDWPFAKVAYPGRSMDWNTWDSLVAANKAGKAGSN